MNSLSWFVDYASSWMIDLTVLFVIHKKQMKYSIHASSCRCCCSSRHRSRWWRSRFYFHSSTTTTITIITITSLPPPPPPLLVFPFLEEDLVPQYKITDEYSSSCNSAGEP